MDAFTVTIVATVVLGAVAVGGMCYVFGHHMLHAIALHELWGEARRVHEQYLTRLKSLRGDPIEVDVVGAGDDGIIDAEVIGQAA